MNDNKGAYAPIVIPTLCRSRHFRQSLESLMVCSGADKTDVYVALDYPAQNEHWKGYNETCKFLQGILHTHPFKSLNVIKRDRNYGLGIDGNLALICEVLFQKYSTLILSEDDNVFAPAFIEFVNKYLQKAEIDKNIFAVCGYQFPVYISENRIYMQNAFSAWGYGYTKESWLIERSFSKNPSKIKEIVRSKKFRDYCIKNGKRQFYLDVVGMSEGRDIWGDSLISAIQIAYGMKSIFPGRSLVRNIGWDGSGTHGGIKKCFSNQDLEMKYDILNYKWANDKENQEVEIRLNKWFENVPIIQKILTRLSWKIYQITGKYVYFAWLRGTYRKIRTLTYKIGSRVYEKR